MGGTKKSGFFINCNGALPSRCGKKKPSHCLEGQQITIFVIFENGTTFWDFL
jgi:hypothetical protein